MVEVMATWLEAYSSHVAMRIRRVFCSRVWNAARTGGVVSSRQVPRPLHDAKRAQRFAEGFFPAPAIGTFRGRSAECAGCDIEQATPRSVVSVVRLSSSARCNCHSQCSCPAADSGN
jgi:hypothetical protein